MKQRLWQFTVFISFFALVQSAAAGSSDPDCEKRTTKTQLVWLNPCGKLSYGLYANEGDTVRANRLPDFSFAGYMGARAPIPNYDKADITLHPRPDGDLRGDTDRIQDAIKEIESMKLHGRHHRGVLLLKAGLYRVDGTLKISKSGVVIRGEGMGADGTVIASTGRNIESLILVQGPGPTHGEFPKTSEQVDITSTRVAVGSSSLDVAKPKVFHVGDKIVVQKRPNDAWIKAIGMGDRRGSTDVEVWRTIEMRTEHVRTITGIDGNKISVDIPFVDSIEKRYGGGYVYKVRQDGMIDQVGIENMQLVSAYKDVTDETHTRNAIDFQFTTNSWIQNITAKYFWYAAIIFRNSSSFNTAQDVAHLKPASEIIGSRRYSFNFAGGVGIGNLVQRCYASHSRHTFVANTRVVGPQVWLDCLTENSKADDGPHQSWATGLLLDSLVGTAVNVQNQRRPNSEHGWTGAQVMLWNLDYAFFTLDAPKTAMNWAVGVRGERRESRYNVEAPGLTESLDGKPRSLYLQQLKDRLGQKAVEAVTIPRQRQGEALEVIRERTQESGPWSRTRIDPTCERGILSEDRTQCNAEGATKRAGKKSKRNDAALPSCLESEAPCEMTNSL